jgi:hypothetical protein
MVALAEAIVEALEEFTELQPENAARLSVQQSASSCRLVGLPEGAASLVGAAGGTTAAGPGAVQIVNESMSARAAAYQQAVPAALRRCSI